MTERNFEKELYYHTYMDMENGNDTETICYPSLICIITELCDRIEQLEIASGKRNHHKDIVSVVKLSQGNLKTDASSGMIHP